MDAGTLHARISEVCPVVATRVGVADNRATWSYEAKPEATQPQKDAADNVIQTIPIETVPPAQPAEFIRRFTTAEYLLLKQKHEADLAANDATNIQIWDVVIGANNLNLNSTDAATLKAELVTDGILTQVRADEVFGSTPGTQMF